MHAHNLKKWFAGSIMVHYGTKIEQRNLSLVGRCRFARWPLATVHGFLEPMALVFSSGSDLFGKNV